MLMFLFCVCALLLYMDQKIVIQTKSVEYMPLSLSLASLVNAICWTAYALIKFDLYITVSYCHLIMCSRVTTSLSALSN